MTIQVDENGNLIIARILGGSTAAGQGLLRAGEVILEVNGKLVRNPDELQLAIADAKENLTLKLAPGIAADGSKPAKSTVIFFMGVILYTAIVYTLENFVRNYEQ